MQQAHNTLDLFFSHCLKAALHWRRSRSVSFMFFTACSTCNRVLHLIAVIQHIDGPTNFPFRTAPPCDDVIPFFDEIEHTLIRLTMQLLNRFCGALLAAAVIVVLNTGTAYGGFMTIRNCTDKALCFSGCETYTLQADQCLPTTGGSQVLSCPPAMSVCGDLAYFTDALCGNLLMMDAFLCDQCNKNQQTGQYTTAVCSRQGIFEYLQLSGCTDGTCGACNAGANMTRDECVPFGSTNTGVQLYAKYRGARICNAIRVEKWTTGSVTCAAAATQEIRLPEDACIDGLAVSCSF